jgi:phosphatidylserine/phosphatidylglycerophosphate/cardiolipin synthase-like enzyme
MTYTYRRIFKSQLTGSATIRELLQSMFVGELLRPPASAWIVSPWVSNVVLLDNRNGSFDAINPEWGHREVRLADVLLALMTRGSNVAIVTRNQASNVKFVADFRELTERHLLQQQASIRIRETLHTKGILLSRNLLLGSMNLTYSGLQINDEWIEFSLDPEDIARTRLEFESYVGNS